MLPVDGSHKLLTIIKCAFSQDHAVLMEKVREAVRGWPDTLLLIIVILINEVQDYCSPKEGSATWKFFSRQQDCLSAQEFYALGATLPISADDDHGSNSNSSHDNNDLY